MKTSKLYDFMKKMIAGENIEEFDIGVNSKSILFKIKDFLERDEGSEFKEKLLKSHKINLRIAKRMILDKQSEERRRERREEWRKNNPDLRPNNERTEDKKYK